MHRIIGLTLVLFLSLHAMASAWQLEATDTTGYVAPALGNGQIGVVMSADGLRPAAMFTATAFRDGRPGQVSTLQKAIIPISIDLTADGGAMCPIADWRQTLDMRHAEVSTSYITPSMDVTCTMRALRSMPHALMAEVSITARRGVRTQTHIDKQAAHTIVAHRHCPHPCHSMGRGWTYKDAARRGALQRRRLDNGFRRNNIARRQLA